MSRAVIHDPVVSQVTTAKIANPATVNALTVVLDPVSHQYTGTQTATPGMPPS